MLNLALLGSLTLGFYQNAKAIKYERVGNDEYICTTNGVCQYNAHPAEGQSRWTYGIVTTEKTVNANGGHTYVTHCFDSGNLNCRVQECSIYDHYSDDGRLIYTADYADDYINNAMLSIETHIMNNEMAGNSSDNEQKGDYLIYRGYEWSKDSVTNKIQSKVYFEVFEIIDD